MSAHKANCKEDAFRPCRKQSVKSFIFCAKFFQISFSISFSLDLEFEFDNHVPELCIYKTLLIRSFIMKKSKNDPDKIYFRCRHK